MNRTLAAALLALSLGACQQQDSSGSAPAGQPGIAAREGVLVLPAVKGNPGAAYFTVFNGNEAVETIAAVAVEGAGRAEMHSTMHDTMGKLDTVPIKPGWTERFIPGARHVMVFDLGPGLEAGGKAEMTLTFADGDKFTVPLAIEAAGGAMEHDH